MTVQVIGEIGINHSGSLETALALMQVANAAGCDMVKYQKRLPSLSVPMDMRSKPKETPWGMMTYMEYRERTEFGHQEFGVIAERSKELGLPWFGSAFDIPSADFLLTYEPEYIKVPSAKLTDHALLRWLSANAGPVKVIVSTGMSTWYDIKQAMQILAHRKPIIMHCTSTYPCPPEELNLSVITSLKREYPEFDIGYSGHEVSLAPSVAAVALGACMIERHITLDRSSWGSDQSSSVEPAGLRRLVKDIRLIERSMGDGVKKIEAGEFAPLKRLRG